MGLVSIVLISHRSNLIYTRLVGLRAVNSSLPVGCSFVFVVCRVCSLFLSSVFVVIERPVSVANHWAQLVVMGTTTLPCIVLAQPNTPGRQGMRVGSSL